MSFDPNFTFGSEAANLEYSILSAILGNPSPPDSSETPPAQDLQYSRWSSDPIDLTSNLSPSYTESQISVQQQSNPALSGANVNSAHYLTFPFSSGQRPAGPTELTYSTPYPSQTVAIQQLPERSVNDSPRTPISFQPSASKDAQAGELSFLDNTSFTSSAVSMSALSTSFKVAKY